MAIPRKTREEFFWLRVRKTDNCWEWIGSKDSFGYGVIQLGRNEPKTGAHRVSWEIHKGQLPKDKDNKRGTCVLHHCDNPSCVNPDHLFTGSRADNSHDAMKKGRLNVPGKDWLGKRTHCPKGHLFDEINTKIHNGVRLCRKCRAKNQKNYLRRKCEQAYNSC